MAWAKNVRALTIFNALRGAVVGGYIAVFPVYMRSLGYSMKSIGGIISASSIVLAVVLPYIGYLNDKYGPRSMIAVSTITLAVSNAIAASTSSIGPLAVSYGLFLFSFLVGQPARMSFLAASVPGESLGRAIGVTTGAFSASRTLGPALAGIAARALGFRPAFEGLALLGLASLAVFAALSSPVRVAAVHRSPLEAYKALLRPPRGFREVLAYVSMDRIAWSMWFPLVNAHLYSYGYREDMVGLLGTLQGGVQTLLLPPAGRLTDRGPAWRVMAASDLLGVASALLLVSPVPLPRAVASMSLLGASIALWIPGYNALIARIAGGTGTSYAAANTARSLFSAPFPYLGGRIYDQLGPQAAFLSSAALMVATTLYAALRVAPLESAALAGDAYSTPAPTAMPGVRRGAGVQRARHGG